MGDTNLIKQNNRHLRCVKCSKLLAKSVSLGNFEIKCLRCGALNLVFEQVTDQFIIIDQQGVILYINEAVEKQTGYSREEAVGKKPSNLWGNQMPKKFYTKMWKAIKEDKKSFQANLINKKKNGELYNLRLVISPILDAKGEILFYVGTEVLEPEQI